MKITIQNLETKTMQDGKLLTIVTDVNGNKYSVWDSAVANQLKQGQSFDVIIKTVQSKAGNFYVNITGLVSSVMAFTDKYSPNLKREPLRRDPAESRLIVRQNALTNAKDWCIANKLPLESIKPIVDLFVDIVYEKPTPNTAEQLSTIPNDIDYENIPIKNISF